MLRAQTWWLPILLLHVVGGYKLEEVADFEAEGSFDTLSYQVSLTPLAPMIVPAK